MRVVFVGASATTVDSAETMIRRGHEVIVVERDRERIETLSDTVDCGFIHGDGTRPDVLRQTDPGRTHVLFCLTGNDQANIIASLVGQSLGFQRTFTKLDNREFEHIGLQLGLQDIIVPARMVGSYLADIAEGHDMLEISALLKDEARLTSVVAHKDLEGSVADLPLPGETRVVCIYRDSKFLLPDDSTKIKRDDEIVLVTHRRHLPEIRERFVAHRANNTTDAPGS